MFSDEPRQGRRPYVAPGWHRDLSNAEYHGSLGWSSSQLKVLLERTPAHLRVQMGMPHETTPSMALGTAVHTLLLEPDSADRELAVMPEGLNLRTKVDRETREAFLQENADRTVLTAAQMGTAQVMAESVMSHPMAAILLSDVIAESSVYWWYRSNDPDDRGPSRQMLKARPDALNVAHGAVIDIKTTVDAGMTAFSKTMAKYYYHLSAAMYLDGINQCKPLLEATGHFAYTKFVFICVESAPPFACAVYELSAADLDLGKQLYHRALRALPPPDEQEWPAYPTDIRVIELPAWAHRAAVV